VQGIIDSLRVDERWQLKADFAHDRANVPAQTDRQKQVIEPDAAEQSDDDRRHAFRQRAALHHQATTHNANY
jgi:hypothetical protein